MRRDYTGCFRGSCYDDDDDDDNVDGYFQLDPGAHDRNVRMQDQDGGATDGEEGKSGYFRPVNSYQRAADGGRAYPVDDIYTEVDVKGKRLRKKLQRRELMRRIRHYIHSTWKWFKRGMSALPGMTSSMFMFSPSPNALATVTARREAARADRSAGRVYL